MKKVLGALVLLVVGVLIAYGIFRVLPGDSRQVVATVPPEVVEKIVERVVVATPTPEYLREYNPTPTPTVVAGNSGSESAGALASAAGNLNVSSASAGAGCSVTTGDAQRLIGLNVQRLDTEPCAWVWRGKPDKGVATCPKGWICTEDVVNDITVVYEGIGQKTTIFAGTFRYPPGYPAGDAVYDVCALFLKEYDFGQRENPAFEVRFQPVPEGKQCPGVPGPTPRSGQVAVASTPTPAPAAAKPCPKFGDVQTVLDPKDNGCKYKGDVVEKPVPSGWWAHYWNGTKVVDAASGNIKTGEATFYQNGT